MTFRPTLGAMDTSAPRARRVRDLDAAIGEALDDVEGEPDHRAGVRDAAGISDMLRRHVSRAAAIRAEHLDAAAVEGELDLAGLAELAGGVTRQRASQLRKAARDRRAEATTGESA